MSTQAPAAPAAAAPASDFDFSRAVQRVAPREVRHELPDRAGFPKLVIKGCDWTNEPRLGRVAVILGADGGSLSFQRHMSPAEARQLAVYLVDCANGLDNPAARVIVDEGEGLGHE